MIFIHGCEEKMEECLNVLLSDYMDGSLAGWEDGWRLPCGDDSDGFMIFLLLNPGNEVPSEGAEVH